MFPDRTTIRERFTLHSWQTTANAPRTPVSAPPVHVPVDQHPAVPAIDIGRPYQLQDFGAPANEMSRSYSTVLDRVRTLGAVGKSGWTDLAVQTCRAASGRDRARLLLAMARNGFTATEAEAAGLRFPGQYLALALVRFAQEGNVPWTRYLVHDIRHGLHLLHRSNGHRELTAALVRGDVPAAEALRAAGYRHEDQPWSSYAQTALTGETQVLQAAVAAGVRFDQRHRPYADAAAARGDLAYVRFLHENGMPLDQRQPVNALLWRAVESGNRELVQYMLTRGAASHLHDIGEQPPFTVMHAALRRRDLPMADLLIGHGYQIHGEEREAYGQLRRALNDGRHSLDTP